MAIGPWDELSIRAEVICGLCTAWAEFSRTTVPAAERAREMGWTRSRWDGWVCPGCAGGGWVRGRDGTVS